MADMVKWVQQGTVSLEKENLAMSGVRVLGQEWGIHPKEEGLGRHFSSNGP